MIDIENDNLLTLRQATKKVPGKPHISTVYRWTANKKLDSIKVGGKRFTSVQAIRLFIERCTGRKLSSQPTGQCMKRVTNAERELAEDGI